MNELLSAVEHLVEAQTVAFIASVDEQGFPCMKAMLAPRVREGLKTFYLTSNTGSMRVRHYRHDPRAGLYFCDAEGFRGVMLQGEMEPLTDAASRRLIWREGDTEYYPLGVDDPDYCVLRFRATKGRYYSDFSSQSFEIE